MPTKHFLSVPDTHNVFVTLTGPRISVVELQQSESKFSQGNRSGSHTNHYADPLVGSLSSGVQPPLRRGGRVAGEGAVIASNNTLTSTSLLRQPSQQPVVFTSQGRSSFSLQSSTVDMASFVGPTHTGSSGAMGPRQTSSAGGGGGGREEAMTPMDLGSATGPDASQDSIPAASTGWQRFRSHDSISQFPTSPQLYPLAPPISSLGAAPRPTGPSVLGDPGNAVENEELLAQATTDVTQWRTPATRRSSLSPQPQQQIHHRVSPGVPPSPVSRCSSNTYGGDYGEAMRGRQGTPFQPTVRAVARILSPGIAPASEEPRSPSPACFTEEKVILCVAPAAPIRLRKRTAVGSVDSGGSQELILVALGWSDGSVSIVLPQDPSATLPSSASAFTASTQEPNPSAWSVSCRAPHVASALMLDERSTDEAVTTITWLRGRSLICAGHRSGRLSWYAVENLSLQYDSCCGGYYPEGEPDGGNGFPGGLFFPSLRYLVTYPTFASNTLSTIYSTVEAASGRLLLVGTSTEIILFNVAPPARRSLSAQHLAKLGGTSMRAASFAWGPSSPLSPRRATAADGENSPSPMRDSLRGGYPRGSGVGKASHDDVFSRSEALRFSVVPDIAQLRKPVGVIPRAAEYIAAHPFLPFFAVLCRGPVPHVSVTGPLQSVAPGTVPSVLTAVGGASRTSGGGSAPHPGGSSEATAAAGNGSLLPLHAQLFVVRSDVCYACGPARLIRAATRPDAILDAVWRYSTELQLLVNTSDDSRQFRLLRFTAPPQDALGDSGAATAGRTGIAFHWQERLLSCLSHSAVMNIEWMSAGSSIFSRRESCPPEGGVDRRSTRRIQALGNRLLSPATATSAAVPDPHSVDISLGFGTTSHIVGFTMRGELTIVAVYSDPTVSIVGDRALLVGIGGSFCRGDIDVATLQSPSSSLGARRGSPASHTTSPVSRSPHFGSADGIRNDPQKHTEHCSVEALMVARVQQGFGVVGAAATTGGGPHDAPQSSVMPSSSSEDAALLSVWMRLVRVLDSVRINRELGPQVGLLELLGLRESDVPTIPQLMEWGMLPAAGGTSSPSQLPVMCPSSLTLGNGNDPRRVLILHVLDWIPSPPPQPQQQQHNAVSASAAATSSAGVGRVSGVAASAQLPAAAGGPFLSVTAPWLTSSHAVQRLAAQLLFLQRVDEAIHVLCTHHLVDGIFPPLGAILTGFFNSDGNNNISSAVVMPLLERLMENLCPELAAAIGTLISRTKPFPSSDAGVPHIPESFSAGTKQNVLSSPVYGFDHPQLRTVDRIAIAVLRFRDYAQLVQTLRSYFLTSAVSIGTRLLLEGVNDDTSRWMQRHVDNKGDVQLATCLFARCALWYASLAGTTSPPSTEVVLVRAGTVAAGTGGVGAASPPTAFGISAYFWKQWLAAYREFLNERRLYIARTSLDVELKALERMRAVVARDAPASLPHSVTGAGSFASAGAAGGDFSTANTMNSDSGSRESTSVCVCQGRRDAHAILGAPDLIVRSRICSVCRDKRWGQMAVAATVASAPHTVLNDLQSRAFVWCTACGHGGHAGHLQDWFASSEKCAVVGCYCRCVAGMAHT